MGWYCVGLLLLRWVVIYICGAFKVNKIGPWTGMAWAPNYFGAWASTTTRPDIYICNSCSIVIIAYSYIEATMPKAVKRLVR